MDKVAEIPQTAPLAVRPEPSAAWLLLQVVPTLLVGVLLIPGMGMHEEGLLAELFGQGVVNSEDFLEFATEVKRWGAAILGTSCVIGALGWLLLRNGWRAKARAFRADRLFDYRGHQRQYMLATLVTAMAAGLALLALSTRLRSMPVANWILMGGMSAAFAALQFLATTWAVSSTRRLYRGR
jgi:hypothetical protein